MWTCAVSHPMRPNENRPSARAGFSRFQYVERPGTAAALRSSAAPGLNSGHSWNTATALSATCVFTCLTARWMLDLGWPKRISSSGGIYVQTDGESNISDTQTAIFEYDGFNATWQHRTWGTAPDPTDYPWALFIHGEKGTLKDQHHARRLYSQWRQRQTPFILSAFMSASNFRTTWPRRTLKSIAHSATRRHMLDFLAAIEKRAAGPSRISSRATFPQQSCILAKHFP